jgi:acyl-coenzyme A synthetase/AMP-(fatty) acid ligase
MASFDKVTKISAGPKVHEPTKVFRARIFDNLQSTPKRIFQISDDEGTEMTYEELKSYSIRVAMNLRRLDIKEGDVISVLLKNSTYVAPIIIGCMLNGSIFNPLTHQIRFDSNWFGMHLSAVHPKLVIMEQFAENYQDMLSLVEEMKINCRIFLLNHHDENLTDVKSELLEKHQKWNDEDEERYFIENILQTSHNKIDNNSILALIPSSGTTGKPKLIQWNGKHAYGAGSFW